jgi:hypothetical protein
LPLCWSANFTHDNLGALARLLGISLQQAGIRAINEHSLSDEQGIERKAETIYSLSPQHCSNTKSHHQLLQRSYYCCFYAWTMDVKMIGFIRPPILWKL